jgi:hypothetical protein
MPLSRNVRIFAAGVLQEESQRDYDWDEVRTERDKDLANTDWRALKDVTLSTAWREYRQALRDITEHPDANTAVDQWPVMPDA